MDREHILVSAVLGAVAVLLAVVGAVAVRYARQTRVALREWTGRNGWTFVPKEPNLTDRWSEHPIRGAGSASNVVRGTVPEGKITCFLHRVTSAGSSTTTARAVGVLEVATALPTVVAVSPTVRVSKPRPPEVVDLGDPQFTWSLYAADQAGAVAAARLFTPQVRSRLTQEAASVPRLELTFEGQQILVSTLGYLEVGSLESWVSILRDLARMMRVG